MTKEEIIEMAKQAGLHIATDVNWMPIIGFEYAEKFAKLIAEKEREECAKICSEFPDVGYVKAILTCDYHSYLINKRGTKMSAIPISQMANDILKIIEEVALDYPEEEREELKAVMLGQLGLAMFNRPMEGKND